MDPVTIAGLTQETMSTLVSALAAAGVGITYIIYSNKVKIENKQASSGWMSPRFLVAIFTQIQVIVNLFN